MVTNNFRVAVNDVLQRALADGDMTAEAMAFLFEHDYPAEYATHGAELAHRDLARTFRGLVRDMQGPVQLQQSMQSLLPGLRAPGAIWVPQLNNAAIAKLYLNCTLPDLEAWGAEKDAQIARDQAKRLDDQVKYNFLRERCQQLGLSLAAATVGEILSF